ncbi:MAG: hypothetical protein F6K14_17125 [Symploca sp. SIO2C1]|nr:hypothetical protein [Symploca sp. SIO2C1]
MILSLLKASTALIKQAISVLSMWLLTAIAFGFLAISTVLVSIILLVSAAFAHVKNLLQTVASAISGLVLPGMSESNLHYQNQSSKN